MVFQINLDWVVELTPDNKGEHTIKIHVSNPSDMNPAKSNYYHIFLNEMNVSTNSAKMIFNNTSIEPIKEDYFLEDNHIRIDFDKFDKDYKLDFSSRKSFDLEINFSQHPTIKKHHGIKDVNVDFSTHLDSASSKLTFILPRRNRLLKFFRHKILQKDDEYPYTIIPYNGEPTIEPDEKGYLKLIYTSRSDIISPFGFMFRESNISTMFYSFISGISIGLIANYLFDLLRGK